MKGWIINDRKERKGIYNMKKITVMKEVGMSKHIFKGLIVSLLAILLMTFNVVAVLALNARSGDIK